MRPVTHWNAEWWPSEPTSDRIYVSNNAGTTITVLASTDGATLGTIEVGGAPEAAVADLKGHVYVNIEDKNEIVAIDAATMAVTAHWALRGKKPTGLAMDVKHRRLFSGCRDTKTMEVLDADSGKTVASLPIGAGVDGSIFDPATGNAFSSNGGDGTLTIVHEDTPDTFRVLQSLPTRIGAKTMAFDGTTRRILLVAAERVIESAADPAAPRRVTYKPGTFAILVVGQ